MEDIWGKASPIEDNPEETKQHGVASGHDLAVIGMGIPHVRD